jgi:hypothetical protein
MSRQSPVAPHGQSRPGFRDALVMLSSTGLGMLLVLRCETEMWAQGLIATSDMARTLSLKSWIEATAFRLNIDISAGLVAIGCGTAAVVLSRLRLARARRIRPGPGQIAVVIGAALAVLFGLVFLLCRAFGVTGPMVLVRAFGLMLILEAQTAYAIVGAWLTLALTGLWRSRPHWTDRLGRAWGWAWLVMMLADRLFWPNFFG